MPRCLSALCGFLDRVELVGQFKGAIADGSSRCHQMLMGAGKTTVVGPLLALLLGDGEHLVLQVVPRALFEFSCGVLRKCFSAVLQKQVYTFRYDRFRPPSEALFEKLQKACKTRAVVVTTPTALKSFTLKFVETCHIMQELRAEQEAKQRAKDDMGAARRVGFSLLSLLGRLAGRARAEADTTAGALAALSKQASLCARIFGLFRAGTLVLDEVDLILHPLKSELNWPLGVKARL